jgi:hypothetical protein
MALPCPCAGLALHQSARSRIEFNGFANAHDARHDGRCIRVQRFTPRYLWANSVEIDPSLSYGAGRIVAACVGKSPLLNVA